MCVCGVSNLLTREVVEWMGMGVTTMPVIKMNRYTKSACRCTCIDQYTSAHVVYLLLFFVLFLTVVRMGMLFIKINVNGLLY